MKQKPSTPSPPAAADLSLPGLDVSPAAELSAADGKKTVPANVLLPLLPLGAADAQALDQKLRAIARETNPDTNSPYLPAPKRGRYELAETIRGVIAWLRKRAERAEAQGSTLPTYPSMEAMSAATGIPKPVLQSAKANGSPGFEYSRCNAARIIPWLFGQGADGEGRNWTSHYEQYRALNEEAKYRETIGELMPRDVALEAARAAQAIYFTGLDRQDNEFPTLLSGREAAQVKKRVADYNDRLRKQVDRQLQALEKKTDKEINQLQKQAA